MRQVVESVIEIPNDRIDRLVAEHRSGMGLFGRSITMWISTGVTWSGSSVATGTASSKNCGFLMLLFFPHSLG